MVQVDLITGFLGAGKTTFLRRYAAYLVAQGHNVCILENDFGAVNVDAMLVQDLLGDHCEIETISGGCDCDTHQRRMRTKLISMAMRGFDRVLVEPSGIFDVDEFFDILRDDPLDRWYQLGNVIAIALTACKCSRSFQPGEFLTKDWADLTDADFAALDCCGYRQASCEKLHFDEHRAFGSAYFLELGLPREQLGRNIPSLFTDPACGHVLRVKGFVQDAGGWVELNATADGLTAAGIPNGQEVLIVIGEGLEKEKIEEKLKR